MAAMVFTQTAISLRSKCTLLTDMHSYGFCLRENPLNTFKFRVVIGTSPHEAIASPTDLLPTAKMLEDLAQC